MALVTRSTSASLDASTGMYAPQITGNLYAGEALDVVAACYIKSSDGLVYMSNGTAADEAAKFDGFTARACAVGEPVTLFGIGARFRYGTGLTKGANYYIAATAGRLDTAATVGGVNPIARVRHNGTDIQVLQSSELGGAGSGAPASVTAGMVALANTKLLIGDAAGAAAEFAVTGDITLTAGGVAAIGAGKVTQAMHVAASEDGTVVKVAANVNVIGAIPVIHRIDLAAGALADTDITLTHKTRVLDAWLVLRGAGVANTTLQVKSTAAAITDAMAASGADTLLVRAANIDDANHEIAAGGILRVTSATGATQPAATVYVLGVRVA